jgi:hypothetical protein
MLRRRWILLAPVLLGSCAGHLTAPPEYLSVDRIWESSKYGMVYAVGYFTEDQMRSAAWEAKRREMGSTVEVCTGESRFVRRDVHWFPATTISGRQCALVVYTIQCDAPTMAPLDTFERDRESLLKGEANQVIGKNCGEKDNSRLRPGLDSSYFRDFRTGSEMLVDHEVCDFQAPSLDGQIRILPTTRIAVDIRMDSALAARYPSLQSIGRDDYRRRFQGNIQQALYDAGKLETIFPPEHKVSKDPANITVTAALGLNRSGHAYCIQLTATQDGRRWRRTIERDQAPFPTVRAMTNGEPVPTPVSDATALSSALDTAMGLPVHAR